MLSSVVDRTYPSAKSSLAAVELRVRFSHSWRTTPATIAMKAAATTVQGSSADAQSSSKSALAPTGDIDGQNAGATV